MSANRSRELLVALNASLELPREVVYRLALAVAERGAPGGRTALRALCRDLGLRREMEERVAAVAADAAPAARREETGALRSGARLLALGDPGYPTALTDLSLPPAVLYVAGELPPQRGVGIVGSRRADAYGLEAAEAFARALATWGLPVVSGFARGVDAAAHKAAAAAPGGRTVAVLGCGLDIAYPRGHRRLRREVAGAGALVTEFPLGTAPLAANFPVRNRLIAALSHGVLVVQATASSGSLITARLALELGRDVYAVPGRIFDPRAAGPNALIRDGALLAQDPGDIVESLPEARQRQLAYEPTAHRPEPPVPGLGGELLRRLATTGAQPPEALARAAGEAPERVLAALLELELAGRVRREPGPVYRLSR